MLNIWKKISVLGISDPDTTIRVRNKIMTNRINAYLFVSMIILLGVDLIVQLDILSFRLVILLVLSALNFIIASRGYFRLVRINLIYIPVFVFVILTSLLGLVQEEGYFYYPIVIIAFSLIPQLVLDLTINKKFYFISISYFLIVLVVYDKLMIIYGPGTLKAPELISEFYIYYKVAPIIAFLFLTFSIYYIRRLNYEFEQEQTNINEELSATLEELNQTQMHLVQSEKMASLGTLTAGIAHELNNPLNHISVGVQLIKGFQPKVEECLPENSQKEYIETLDILSSGVDATTSIVKSLMTFSYRGEPKRIETDINNIIDSTIKFLRSKRSAGIKITKDYRFSETVLLFADRLHQVFLNILDNALYAISQNEGDKLIKISTYKNDGDLVIEVFNNGAPISEANLNKLYDPFFTTKNPGEGTGLGLAICYSLVQEHGGSLKAENVEGGVRFLISIPINEEL